MLPAPTIEELNEVFALLIWLEGASTFVSEISTSPAFGASEVIKEMTEQGKGWDEITAMLVEKLGERHPETGIFAGKPWNRRVAGCAIGERESFLSRGACMLRELLKIIQEEEGGHTLTELAHRLGVSKGLVIQMLNDLERKGYLTQTPRRSGRACATCALAKACSARSCPLSGERGEARASRTRELTV